MAIEQEYLARIMEAKDSEIERLKSANQELEQKAKTDAEELQRRLVESTALS